MPAKDSFGVKANPDQFIRNKIIGYKEWQINI